LSKIQNYALWRSGEYGNKLRAWRSYDEWSKSGFSGLVALRTLGPGGGPCIYDLYPSSVKFHYEILLRTGISANQIMFNEMAPNSIGSIILQGEYLNDIFTLNDIVCWSYFYYSRAQHPMRDALKKSPEIAVNMKADLLLRLAMTPASYEDWLGLLDKYYGHVLEVSVFDHCLGDTPNRNALVWEVRKY
jgi:hypothetical protein